MGYKCAKCGELKRARCDNAPNEPCPQTPHDPSLESPSCPISARPPHLRFPLNLRLSFPRGICKPPTACGADGCKSRKLEEQRATAECSDVQRIRIEEVSGDDPDQEARRREDERADLPYGDSHASLPISLGAQKTLTTCACVSGLVP